MIGMKTPSGGLLEGGSRLDNAHDVGLLHDQEILAIDLDLGAGPLAEEHPVANPYVGWKQLTLFVTCTGADSDHLALLGLLFGGIWNDDLNRPGFAGGSNFQIGWSHDEQNDEQVFP